MSEEFQQNSVESLHESHLNAPFSTAKTLPDDRVMDMIPRFWETKKCLDSFFLSFLSLFLPFIPPYTDNILNIPLIMYN